MARMSPMIGLEKVYVVAGHKTVQLGSGRKEFDPRNADYMQNRKPHLDDMIVDAGLAVLGDVAGSPGKIGEVAELVDSGHFGNFMMQLTNNMQGHRPGFLSSIHPNLEFMATSGTEGACASGGLALAAGIKDILARQADLVLVVGAEEQNLVKAIYGADMLSGAGHINRERKEGAAFFFPGAMSERVGAYIKHYEHADEFRAGMTQWVVNAYANGNLDPLSQIFKHGMSEGQIRVQAEKISPSFTRYLSALDCSKVTDAAAAVILASEEGLKKLRSLNAKFDYENTVQVVGLGMSGRDMTSDPAEPYKLATTESAMEKVYRSALALGVVPEQIGLAEVHDCFSNIGVMMLEAAGIAEFGEGWKYVLDGHTARNGECPVNPFGGLMSGHPVGETGVRQAVDIYHQLTGQAGANQINMTKERPFALALNMGGNDVTTVATLYR